MKLIKWLNLLAFGCALFIGMASCDDNDDNSGELKLSTPTVTESQPLDTSSMLMLPVPAKRSRAQTPPSSRFMYLLDSTLNRFSLAKSVVGRALKERGTSKRLLLYIPLITRMRLWLAGQGLRQDS